MLRPSMLRLPHGQGHTRETKKLALELPKLSSPAIKAALEAGARFDADRSS